jgi:hypothetical protein
MEHEFDFERFLGRVSDMNLDEITTAAEEEAERVKRLLYPPKGERGVGGQSSYPAHHYHTVLLGFIFFLNAGSRHGIKPGGISEAEFKSFKPVMVKLVEKGELPPTVLEPFYS